MDTVGGVQCLPYRAHPVSAHPALPESETGPGIFVGNDTGSAACHQNTLVGTVAGAQPLLPGLMKAIVGGL